MVTAYNSLSKTLGLAIDMCTTIGGGIIDKISEMATENSSLSQFLGLATDMCSTIGGGASGRSSKWLLGTAVCLIPRPSYRRVCRVVRRWHWNLSCIRMPAKLHYSFLAFAAQHFVIYATYFLEGDVRPTMSTALLGDGAGGVALYNPRALAAQHVWHPVAPVVNAPVSCVSR